MKEQTIEKEQDTMWKYYHVTFNFIGRLCGSVPLKPVIKPWTENQAPDVKPPSGKTLPEIQEEVINRLPDMGNISEGLEEKSTIVFEQVEKKLVVRAGTFRAHLKDCASQVQNQFVGRIKGERNFTTRVRNGLYITGGMRDDFGTEVIFILKNGKPISEWDGFQERLVHANTAQGQINALKKFAYVIKPSIMFTIKVLGNSVKLADLEMLMQYGGTHGYGGERSQQEGQYTFSIREK